MIQFDRDGVTLVGFDAAGIGYSGDAGLVVAFCFDLPLSAVADTLLLPYDLTHSPEE
jgi:uncharacterized protein YceK